MRKETSAAVRYGDPVLEEKPPKPRGTVILTSRELLKRVQNTLDQHGRWAMASETPRLHWSEPPHYTAYEIELQDGGRVKLIPDLEEFGRGLGLVEECERGFPESDFRSAT